MIDFRIETFLCVCKYMNYTKAANELNLTQPGVSQHIKYLENYYGTKLFKYSNRTLTITKEGIELKNAMLSIKHDTQHLKKLFSMSSVDQSCFSFGATLSIGEFFLSKYLGNYLINNSNNCINYTVNNTHELLKKLDDGIIDFAFIEGNFTKKDYDFITIKEEPFICVSGNNTNPQIQVFSDILNSHLLVREDGSGSKEILASYLSEHGYTLQDFSMQSIVNSPYIIKQLLLNNIGISFMYETVVADELKSGKLIKLNIPDFNIIHEFNFVWRKNSIFKEEYIKFYNSLLVT
ncbi:MAG: LysR substrate-binding domain-containing protein [Eubacterium sp.]